MRSIVFFFSLLFSLTANAQYKLYEAGLAKYNEKDYYEAISLLSDFLTKPQRDKKHDADCYYWRGLAAFKLNNFTDAVEDLKRAHELRYKNEGNLKWFLAKSLVKLEQLNEAGVEYGNAIRILSADKVKQAQLLGERALLYQKMGNLPFAEQDLQIASAIDPSNLEVKSQLAALVTAKGGTPEKSKGAEVVSKTNAVQTSSAVSNSTRELVPSPPQSAPVVVEPTLEELYKDEKRFALVIGNSAYSKQIGVLRNPVNDATDFAATLQSIGFEVTLITDASYGKIRAEMMRFRDKLNTGEKDKTVGLFFYAGHGLQNESENYIVPVDAELQYEDDVSRYCFPIQKMVLNQMENTNSRMNIVILDACRNNPFPTLHRGIGEEQGLGEMKKARGAFVAYATSPGSVASDGTGENGLYTQELIKAINKPGRTIEQVFKEVRSNVLRQSGQKQNPWENSNIVGDFYFKF